MSSRANFSAESEIFGAPASAEAACAGDAPRCSAPQPNAAANEAVQIALEELAQFGLQHTAPLERALLHATVFVAVWSLHRPGQVAKSVPIVVDDPSGNTLLALFTDRARLARYAGKLEHRGREVEFTGVPRLISVLRLYAAILDPGHAHSRVLSPLLLARMARA